jgi:hypothetical protein
MPTAERPDLSERLRRLPAALAVDPPPGLLDGVVRQGRRRRLLRRAAAAAAVVVLASGALATRALVADRNAGQVLAPGQVAEASAARLAGGRVRSLPPDPALDRVATAATAWTGRELLVWGGAAPADDAIAGGPMRPGDGLAYDPAGRAWRRLPAPPPTLPASAGPALWTGQELLVVDAEGGRQVPGGGLAGAAYDPQTNRWRPLPASPRLGGGQLLGRTVLWAGTRLLVWSFWVRPGGPARASADPDGVALWAYDPEAGRWTTLPDPSPAVRSWLVRSSLAWTGRDILAVQNTTEIPPDPPRFGGRYDPDGDRWTPIAIPPRRVPFGDPGALAWTGAALLADGDAAYDPAAERWWPLPGPGGWRWAGAGPPLRPLGGGAMVMLVPGPD